MFGVSRRDTEATVLPELSCDVVGNRTEEYDVDLRVYRRTRSLLNGLTCLGRTLGSNAEVNYSDFRWLSESKS